MKELAGKTIKDVFINPEKDCLKFETNDGTFFLVVGADCCSKSWIESINGIENLRDAQILEAENIEMWPNCYQAENTASEEWMDEVLKYYSTKFQTTKGHVDIEYRNESNGYYGANLTITDHISEADPIFDWKGSAEFAPLTENSF